MQDPSSLYSQINPQVQQPQFPEQEHLKCPRCDSPNTKFCYYNNYNLSQPRHFCKSCKRYWTKGGALRNIPVGGASRKNTKRTSNSNKRPAPAPANKSDGRVNGGGQMSETLPLMGEGQFGNLMEVSGSFSSLLEANEGQFGNLIDKQFGDPGSGSRVGLESGSSGNVGGDGFLNIPQW